MCGIFGVRRSWLRGRSPAPEAAIARALERLRWRGRDGAATVAAGDFVLGCARLAITDRRSRQPLARRSSRLCGVINGAITDARQRWQQWRPGLGACRRLPNDAWLPLLLVERGAPAELAALAGHHALAVVDGGRDALVLARDAMGEKPLWVARAGGRVVAFASTLPALAALGVAAELPAAAVAEFFARGSAGSAVAVDPGLTLQDDLAGVDDGERLVPPAAPPAAANGAAGDLAAALTAATARCADAAEPLALCLSGGLDSSCLAAVLGGLGHKVRGYQFQAAGDPGDERAAAAAVAAHTGLALRPVDGGKEVLDALPRLTAHWGLPLGDPSVLALHALASAAAGDGVRVLLSGEGSDEALLGYARHRALALLPRRGLRWLPAPGWSMRRAARFFRALAAADPFAELLAVTPPAFRREVLAGDIATAPPLPDAPTADPLQRARLLEQRWYLRRDLLPKLDVATMAAQVEGRCPYLDAAFRAAAAAIPPRRALGKAPLRAAFAARLPAGIAAQRKRGFALPLDRWFRGELPFIDLLREPRTRQRAHLRAGGLDAAIDRHRRGAADLGHALYLVVAFECWLRSREEDHACT